LAVWLVINCVVVGIGERCFACNLRQALRRVFGERLGSPLVGAFARRKNGGANPSFGAKDPNQLGFSINGPR